MKNKTTLNIILLISIIALASAYFIEYILGYKPCNLCLIERIPYFVAILFILASLIINKLEKIILVMLGLIFLASTILSFYHFGIEQGFFNESLVCITNSSKDLTKDQLLEQLNQNTIGCKNVTFRLLGLSLATINYIFSIILSAIFAVLFLKYGKN